MPKSFLVCIVFFLTGMLYSQSFVFNPILDSSGANSISYGIGEILEEDGSMNLQFELIQINSDELSIIYNLKTKLDQNLRQNNNNLEYNTGTAEFAIQRGVFYTSDLMNRLLVFRNESRNVL